MQLLNSTIIGKHYLIIHTFRGAAVASLLLPNSEVEELLRCLQWSRPHGAAVHLTAVSPGLTTNSYNHIHVLVQRLCHVHDNMEPNIKYTSQKERAMIHGIKEDSLLI
jgi:hypothetical protein